MGLEIDNIPDVSQWQGDIDWSKVPSPIAIIKVSDGSGYLDPKANHNYYGAKGAGKAVGMYHFAEWGDATAEATEFIKAVSPLEDADVLILDVEAIKAPNPVDWVNIWANHVHAQTTVWPLVYMNLSTLNAYNWSPILTNCGLWLADWAVSPHDTIPTDHVYVMQQYSDNGSVPGIQGRVDLDAWFGTVDQFKSYGYKAQPVPAPAPTPEPTPPAVPETPPVAIPNPPPVVPTPTPATPTSGETPSPSPVVTGPAPAVQPQASAVKHALLAFLAAAAIAWATILAFLHS